METPKSKKRNFHSRKTPSKPVFALHSTPRQTDSHSRINGLLVEYSPNSFMCTQDAMEVGWGGDSPILPRPELKYPALRECRSSPSPPNIHMFTIPKVPSPDVTSSLRDIKKLSEMIQLALENSVNNNCTKDEINEERKCEKQIVDVLLKDDDSINECLIVCTQQVENELQNSQVLQNKCVKNKSVDVLNKSKRSSSRIKQSVSKTGNNEAGGTNVKVDTSLEKVLQEFREEDDIWLSQVADQVIETPKKSKFAKCRSHNHLLPAQPSPLGVLTRTSFRRTASFNITTEAGQENVKSEVVDDNLPKPPKRQKSCEFKCSAEEIKRKRAEAFARKNFLESQRKKVSLRLKNQKIKS